MKIICSFLSVSIVSFCVRIFAQQEAIPSYTINPGNVVGYAQNGAGFAFSPTVPIAVTALGFSYGNDSSPFDPFQVSLFDASGHQLATAQLTTANSFHNQTYYQGVSAVNLTVGATYYVGAVDVGGTNSGIWFGSVVGAVDGSPFSVNPDISYLSANTGFMPPGTVPGTALTGQNYLIGANFEFTVVPEPSVFCLTVAALLGIAWRRR
jgi:hypothetical protein